MCFFFFKCYCQQLILQQFVTNIILQSCSYGYCCISKTKNTISLVNCSFFATSAVSTFYWDNADRILHFMKRKHERKLRLQCSYWKLTFTATINLEKHAWFWFNNESGLYSNAWKTFERTVPQTFQLKCKVRKVAKSCKSCESLSLLILLDFLWIFGDQQLYYRHSRAVWRRDM